MERLGKFGSLQTSYYHRPLSTAAAYVTLPEVFDSTANRLPTKTAVVVYQSRDNRECLTFAELQNQSKTLAAALTQRGYARGDRVAFFAPNCIEYFTIQLALSRIGCNIFLLSNLNALESDVWQYKCRALFMYIKNEEEVDICRKLVDRKSRESVEKDVIIFGPKCDVTMAGTVPLDSVMAAGAGHDWDDVKIEAGEVGSNPDDPYCVFLTSGSTGKPKGVQYTHIKYLHQCSVLHSTAITEDSCFFNDRPVTWLGGSMTLLSMAVFGATGVTVNSALVVGGGDVDFVIGVMKREMCTDAVMMHYFMVDLLRRYNPEIHAVPSLRHILTGGQRMDVDVLKQIQALLPHVEYIVDSYGSAECGLVSVARCCHTYKASDGEEIFDGIEVRIVDENHRDVPRGTSGEICVRSPTVYANCYVDNEEASKAVIDNAGWYCTGDIGVIDADGRLAISGRKDDMIKRATVKIFPVDIEPILKQHSGIKDVVVIGVPDDRLGEEICACVILDDASSLADVKSWCKEKFSVGPDGLSIAPVLYVQFSQFPTTASGKTDKRLVKQAALDYLKV
ncbi:acyl-CoA synthetase family member 2, mitochondrial-like [Lingula anatina]|uniref:Acyl-CoA synthetase family member 2, mitochondrial-like n=1 Tax=Lingula anatina TaxID=7574 RepID=A0A1S3ILA2_LINAN|nr:acyl-CoA synthetase family member 2, mitochondrial-like [Lingula anatina]|eukprot:XP_013398299.1 acyl-CoA synthetase family member 2, mitochondrial-like [Lingula anatina]